MTDLENINWVMTWLVIVLWAVYVLQQYHLLSHKSFRLLLGGRPMTNVGFALHDVVAHRDVYYFRDTLDRYWMAFHKWSLFRVEINDKDRFWIDDTGIKHDPQRAVSVNKK